MSGNIISSSSDVFFKKILFDFKLTNLCLDEHMLPHNYSLLNISTAVQTSRKRDFLAGGGQHGTSCLTLLTALSGWLFPFRVSFFFLLLLLLWLLFLLCKDIPFYLPLSLSLLNWPAGKIQIAPLYFITSHLMGQKCLINTALRIWIRPADFLSTHFYILTPRWGQGVVLMPTPMGVFSQSLPFHQQRHSKKGVTSVPHEASPQPKSLLLSISFNARCSLWAWKVCLIFSPSL